jgi:hypothetical protein
MQWRQVQGGLARQFVLENGAAMIGMITAESAGSQFLFYPDQGDLDRLDPQSDPLGGLSAFIDGLRPEDVIDICCRLDEASKSR